MLARTESGQNSKELKPYYGAITTGELATFRGFLLNEDDRLRRYLIMRLMCQTFVSIPHFEKQWGINFREYFSPNLAKLAPLRQDGLVTLTESELRATPLGILFLRNIAMAFDPYLETVHQHAQTPVFSRSV